MTNYDKITCSMPRSLADILDGFNADKIIDWYCAEACEMRNRDCTTSELDGECPITRAEMILRWLNQEAK